MVAPILNGSLTDWTAADVIDKTGSTSGYDVYGRESGGTFYFALQAPVAIGANTTVWFNTDQNSSTGYRIFGSTGGAEYNINFDAGGTPRLYTGDAGQTLVSNAPISFAYSANRTVVEFSVPTSALGTPKVVGTLWDVNNATFLPGDYSAAQYEVVNGSAMPARTDFSKKIGIVYSDTTANAYFSKTAYSQLFMAAQNQAAMAGVHYDVLTEADLTNLAKLANYDALLFPGFRNVQSGQLSAIESTLKLAVQHYKIGLIASGEFMTHSQTGAALPGDAYARMKSLLDLNIVASGFPGDVSLKAANSHPVMQEYAAGESIRNYDDVGWLAFTPFGGTGGSSVLATQTIGTQTYNAVTATNTGGRNVHFSTNEVMADNNLLWQAIDYAVNGTGVTAGVQLSRQTSILAMRNDMDHAMYTLAVDPPDGSPGIYDMMMPILKQWKNAYNFVGSYYIDIGNNAAQDQVTDWTLSGEYYKQILALGNEIGSHSISHPFDTNALTAGQLQSEFQGSRQIIEQQMSQILGRPFVVDGAAVPGAPESLATALSIIQYYDYLSGGFSSIGSGYPSAFGYLNPAMAAQDKVYLAPNLQFDFSLIEFRGMTPAQAMAEWAAEVADLTRHAEVPILLWPVHDYGIAEWWDPQGASPYTTELFTDFISRAYAAGTEFVTLDDLAERISAFGDTRLTSSVSGSTVTATVTSPDAGKFALDLDNLGTQKIARVTGWYAYDDDSVFLPATGGTYTIQLGAAADDVTRIVSLPMRAELLSLTGNGTNLAFSVFGEGRMVIDLTAPASRPVSVTGATVVSLAIDKLTIDLGANGTHNVSVTVGSGNLPPTITSNGGGATATISVAENSTTVTTVVATDPEGQARTYSISGGADAARFAINATTGVLAFASAPDFEAPLDSGRNNVYDLIVSARDTAGLADTQAIAVTVTDVAGLTLNGDGNANTLTGAAEEDTISGLGGNDVLSGLGGNDRLLGGAGNDTLYYDTGLDVMDGGADTDTADFSRLTYGVWVHLAYAAGPYEAWTRDWRTLADLTSIENLTGTRYDDLLAGNASSNRLDGGDGNDELLGEAGNDTLIGGAGNDRLYYQGGIDTFSGGTGTDTADFSAFGAAVWVHLAYAAGPYEAWTRDWQTIADLSGIENLTGTRFNDLLAGDGNANRLDGGDGNDELLGEGGNDTLLGGTGNDTLYYQAGLDIFNGGAGTDTADFSPFGAAVWVHLGYTAGPYEAWTRDWQTIADLSGIENLTGTRFNDLLAGDGNANRLDGGDGNDELLGEGGNDTLLGGTGNDTLYYQAGFDIFNGGAGTDTADFSYFGAAVWVHLAYTAGPYEAWTRADWQTIADVTGIENMNGTRFDDLLAGDAGANRIEGGAGSDTLMGDTGNDILVGGAGADTLSGGAGSDRFDYNAIAEGPDTITDFTRGSGGDILDIRDVLVGYTGNASSFVRFAASGGGTLVSVDADGGANAFAALAVLQNVAFSAGLMNDMLANGNLVLS